VPLAALLFVVSILFEPLRYEYEIIVSVHFAMRLAKHAVKLFLKNFIYVGCVLYECFSDWTDIITSLKFQMVVRMVGTPFSVVLHQRCKLITAKMMLCPFSTLVQASVIRL